MSNAKYTVLLKTLMENPLTNVSLEKALKDYPIYTPENITEPGFIPTRETLNKKILSHYKYREIGFDTPGRFFDELKTSMEEIMPYYNQMFKTVDLMTNIEDIFGNVNVTESYEEKRQGKTTGSGSSETTQEDNSSNTTTATDSQQINNNMSDHSKKIQSDTPANEISITAKDINSVNYASNAEWNKNDSESNGETSGESTSNSNSEASSINRSSGTNLSTEDLTVSHTFTKKGNQGVNTYAHDIIEFRQTILNIEQQIINDTRIKELFMTVY